ncbi:MAG: hypothetical protein JKY60_06195 [Kordiimonadaceae bacterium]|nr:hypothetical protein [Kordiimonadaceae bacterium]
MFKFSLIGISLLALTACADKPDIFLSAAPHPADPAAPQSSPMAIGTLLKAAMPDGKVSDDTISDDKIDHEKMGHGKMLGDKKPKHQHNHGGGR